VTAVREPASQAGGGGRRRSSQKRLFRKGHFTGPASSNRGTPGQGSTVSESPLCFGHGAPRVHGSEPRRKTKLTQNHQNLLWSEFHFERMTPIRIIYRRAKPLPEGDKADVV